MLENWSLCERPVIQILAFISVRASNGLKSSSGSGLDHPEHQSAEGLGPNMTPVCCAILGAIIVSLIIYVILKRWKLCPGDRKKHPVKTQSKNFLINNNNNNVNNGQGVNLVTGVNFNNLIPLNYHQPMKVTSLSTKSPKKSQSSNLSTLSASSVAESQRLRKFFFQKILGRQLIIKIFAQD